MGLFGNDEQQDERLNAIESYLRMLTEMVQQNELDVSSVRLHLVRTQTQLDEKISTDEIDPEFIALNQLLGDARRQMMQASSAAEESWSTLQADVRDAFDTLRAGLEAADCSGEGPN
jgi:hypothetical protein